ncbi:hypothetical protein [Swaminathania salitolerans]|uniref:Uncharacterized protein n=1 Tax=Swaminathania salitolerans TaxID=182838 RepID=A0A511BME0_9PROT|nr:hypothetical protein [Swaminathania salitolerans]GBQ15852.1 hypothetical protein AA21291_2322 [Swaminathania salitolerans LMG 21291]GEL01511.1 hypothetical protein SSA02_06740 [Swaminathania salitolerans]
MNPDLKVIPDRILNLAIGALSQANTHAVYSDPGREYWDHMCILNAAHAGELFLKAIIAREHPLLIFKDLFSLDDNKGKLLDIETLIRRGRTLDFERLPQVLWATTGRRIPNRKCYEWVRLARNSIQHFCAPEKDDLRALSLEFIYTIIDPLIMEVFGLFAIEYHEDPSVGYDYVVSSLLGRELKFSIPDDFTITEISMPEVLGGASAKYKNWIKKQMTKIGRLDLLS